MTKKIFAFIIALALIFAASSVFATTELQDSMDKAGSTIKNVTDGAGSVVRDAGTAITNGAKDLGNTVENGAKNVGSAVEDGTRNLGGAVSNGAERVTSDMTRTDNNGYTATRTSNDATIMGMSANTWTWFVLAIAALAIIGLVWYYVMQNKNEYNHHHHD